MGALQHLDAKLVAQRLQPPAGAAIGVEKLDLVILRALPRHGSAHGLGDAVRRVVKLGGQAAQVQMVQAAQRPAP